MPHRCATSHGRNAKSDMIRGGTWPTYLARRIRRVTISAVHCRFKESIITATKRWNESTHELCCTVLFCIYLFRIEWLMILSRPVTEIQIRKSVISKGPALRDFTATVYVIYRVLACENFERGSFERLGLIYIPPIGTVCNDSKDREIGTLLRPLRGYGWAHIYPIKLFLALNDV